MKSHLHGAMESRIEGRISADDFMRLCAEIDRLNAVIRNYKTDVAPAGAAQYPCT